MNAQLNSTPNGIIHENAVGSDSDTDLDDSPEYYQPISSTAEDDDDLQISDQIPNHVHNSDDEASGDFHGLPNGYAHNCVENGMSSLDLSDGEEEEEIMRDSAVQRPFGEEESRRNAPLTAENATRVMEAMCGVSFGGVAPDWTTQVPEDQWIQHLRTLRTSPPTASTN